MTPHKAGPTSTQQTLSPNTRILAPYEAVYIRMLNFSKSLTEHRSAFLQTPSSFGQVTTIPLIALARWLLPTQSATTVLSRLQLPAPGTQRQPLLTTRMTQSRCWSALTSMKWWLTEATPTALSFFQAALKREWTEGQTRTIKLPEEKPAIVAQYLDFCLGEGLPTRSTKDDCREGAVYDVLGELYGLGKGSSALRSATLSSMRWSDSPPWEAIHAAILRKTRSTRSTNAPLTIPRLVVCWLFGSLPMARRTGSRTVCIRSSCAMLRRRRLLSFMIAV